MNTSASNIVAIAKRELVGYFASPVAYVFLVIYLLLAGFFTFTVRPAFFDYGQASLDHLFPVATMVVFVSGPGGGDAVVVGGTAVGDD